MTDLNQKIVAAWLEASKDLGVRVEAPYRLEAPGPQVISCEAFLPDFGSPAGAVVITSRSQWTAGPVLRQAGRWHSVLGDVYERYGRAIFVETLNDWGWFGPETLKPGWCTGEPWV